jgi:hypothetical protein
MWVSFIPFKSKPPEIWLTSDGYFYSMLGRLICEGGFTDRTFRVETLGL